MGERAESQKIFSMLWWLSPGPEPDSWEFYLDSAEDYNEAQCRDACCANDVCTAYEISENGKCLLFKPDLEQNSPWDHRILSKGFTIGFKTSGVESSVGISNSAASIGRGFVRSSRSSTSKPAWMPSGSD